MFYSVGYYQLTNSGWQGWRGAFVTPSRKHYIKAICSALYCGWYNCFHKLKKYASLFKVFFFSYQMKKIKIKILNLKNKKTWHVKDMIWIIHPIEFNIYFIFIINYWLIVVLYVNQVEKTFFFLKKRDALKTKIKNNLNFLKFDNKRRFFFSQNE